MSSSAVAIACAASGRPNCLAAVLMACAMSLLSKMRLTSDASSPGVRLFCCITTAAPPRAYE